MIIKQEETSPIQNAFDKTHLVTAFSAIESMSGSLAVDTDLYKSYCEESISLLKTLISNVEGIERDAAKKANKNTAKEHLFGNDPYGD